MPYSSGVANPLQRGNFVPDTEGSEPEAFVPVTPPKVVREAVANAKRLFLVPDPQALETADAGVLSMIGRYACAMSHALSIYFWGQGIIYVFAKDLPVGARVPLRRLAPWALDENKVESYVFWWTIVFVLCAAFTPPSGWLQLTLVAIGIYRLQDLTFASLDSALGLTRIGTSRWHSARTLTLILIANIVQVTFIFGLIYYRFTTAASWSNPPTPWSPWGCSFLAWMSLTPFGIGSGPASNAARWWSTIESAVAVLILGIALSRFLSAQVTTRARQTEALQFLASPVATGDRDEEST